VPVYLTCPTCKSTLRLKDNFARAQARCPHCRNVIDVPKSATETVNVRMDDVGDELRARARALGIDFDDQTDLKELSRRIEAAESPHTPPPTDLREEFE